MNDEIHVTREVEVTRIPVDEEAATSVAETTVVYPAARGAWDFTDRQRIVLALLLWLNLMMLGLGYLAITGRI